MNRDRFISGIHPMDDWGNHRILLWLALQGTMSGKVMEFGCGMGSTRQLSEYCHTYKRRLMSFDTDPKYLDMFKEHSSPTHTLHLVENNWGLTVEYCNNPSVILMDHSPGERRKFDIKNYSNENFGIMVIHDTQPKPTAADYGYDDIWKLFKYRVDLQVPKSESGDNRTWASAVSNHYDIRKWAGMDTGFPDYKIVAA